MFQPGQKLECINASGGGRCLLKGRIYICVGFDHDRGGPWVGVNCCSRCDDRMHRWYPHHFRPIIERKTDISEFQNLLNPTPQERRELIGRDLGFASEEIGVEP